MATNTSFQAGEGKGSFLRLLLGALTDTEVHEKTHYLPLPFDLIVGELPQNTNTCIKNSHRGSIWAMSTNANHVTHPIVKLTCKEPMIKEGWGRKVCPRRQMVSGLQDLQAAFFLLLCIQFVRNNKHFPKIKHQHPLSFWSSSNSIHVLPLLRSVPFGWGVSLFAAKDIEEEQ